PLLVRRGTGLPIESPTYWIIASERPLNKAAATLEKQLRHLMVLYLWADARGRTPEDLVRSAGFLALEQLNDLDRFCRQRLADAVAEGRAQRAGGSVVPFSGRKKDRGRPGGPPDRRRQPPRSDPFLPRSRQLRSRVQDGAT